MYAGSKAFFYALSRSAVLKRLASRHGLATPTSFASRFIAGETIEAAIDASSRLQSQGLLVTLDYLGERVRTVEESTAASVGYVRLLEAMVAAGIDRNISLKLTQLGSTSITRRASTICAASWSRPRARTASCGSTWRTRRTPRGR